MCFPAPRSRPPPPSPSRNHHAEKDRYRSGSSSGSATGASSPDVRKRGGRRPGSSAANNEDLPVGRIVATHSRPSSSHSRYPSSSQPPTRRRSNRRQEGAGGGNGSGGGGGRGSRSQATPVRRSSSRKGSVPQSPALNSDLGHQLYGMTPRAKQVPAIKRTPAASTQTTPRIGVSKNLTPSGSPKKGTSSKAFSSVSSGRLSAATADASSLAASTSPLLRPGGSSRGSSDAGSSRSGSVSRERGKRSDRIKAMDMGGLGAKGGVIGLGIMTEASPKKRKSKRSASVKTPVRTPAITGTVVATVAIPPPPPPPPPIITIQAASLPKTTATAAPAPIAAPLPKPAPLPVTAPAPVAAPAPAPMPPSSAVPAPAPVTAPAATTAPAPPSATVTAPAPAPAPVPPAVYVYTPVAVQPPSIPAAPAKEVAVPSSAASRKDDCIKVPVPQLKRKDSSVSLNSQYSTSSLSTNSTVEAPAPELTRRRPSTYAYSPKKPPPVPHTPRRILPAAAESGTDEESGKDSEDDSSDESWEEATEQLPAPPPPPPPPPPKMAPLEERAAPPTKIPTVYATRRREPIKERYQPPAPEPVPQTPVKKHSPTRDARPSSRASVETVDYATFVAESQKKKKQLRMKSLLPNMDDSPLVVANARRSSIPVRAKVEIFTTPVSPEAKAPEPFRPNLRRPNAPSEDAEHYARQQSLALVRAEMESGHDAHERPEQPESDEESDASTVNSSVVPAPDPEVPRRHVQSQALRRLKKEGPKKPYDSEAFSVLSCRTDGTMPEAPAPPPFAPSPPPPHKRRRGSKTGYSHLPPQGAAESWYPEAGASPWEVEQDWQNAGEIWEEDPCLPEAPSPPPGSDLSPHREKLPHMPQMPPRRRRRRAQTEHMPTHVEHMSPHPEHRSPHPVHRTPQPAHRTPQPAHRTPQPAHRTPQPAHRTPQPAHRTPQLAHRTPQPGYSSTQQPGGYYGYVHPGY